eukprot:352861-Chlamydomonas_euryale.AAC.3
MKSCLFQKRTGFYDPSPCTYTHHHRNPACRAYLSPLAKGGTSRRGRSAPLRPSTWALCASSRCSASPLSTPRCTTLCHRCELRATRGVACARRSPAPWPRALPCQTAQRRCAPPRARVHTCWAVPRTFGRWQTWRSCPRARCRVYHSGWLTRRRVCWRCCAAKRRHGDVGGGAVHQLLPLLRSRVCWCCCAAKRRRGCVGGCTQPEAANTVLHPEAARPAHPVHPACPANPVHAANPARPAYPVLPACPTNPARPATLLHSSAAS